METTTESLETTTQIIYSNLLSAADILSDSSDTIEHLGSNQITFEIPSSVDLERIKTLDNFTNLLHRIGSGVIGGSSSDGLATVDGYVHNGIAGDSSSSDNFVFDHHQPNQHYSITSDQISNSVVLNLADLKNSATSGLERFFEGADINSIINYLWIAVVTSLIILSAVFIVFSCYFYRKFREWKKCNKDIRSQMNNEMYLGNGNGIAYAGPSGELLVGHPSENGYYQMESPPCYTIATGLPTYDEALNHHHHRHRQDRYTYGMKFVYPALEAIATTTTTTTAIGNYHQQHPGHAPGRQHHHSSHGRRQQHELFSSAQPPPSSTSTTSYCWEKDDLALTHNNVCCRSSSNITTNTDNNNTKKPVTIHSNATTAPAYHRWQNVQTAASAATIALLQQDDSSSSNSTPPPTATTIVCIEDVEIVNESANTTAMRQNRNEQRETNSFYEQQALAAQTETATTADNESDFCTDIVVVS